MEKPGDEAPAMESTADKTQNDSGFQEHFAQETSDKFVEAPEDTDKELRVQTSSEMTPGLAADERVPEEENATPSSLAPAAPFRMKNKRRASSRMSASTTPSSSTSVPRASRLLGPSVEDPHEIRMEELSVLENGASTESPLASASVKVSVPVSRDASKNGSIHSSSGKPTRSSIWASPVTQPQSLSPHGSMETLKQNGASAPRKQSAFPTLFFSRGRGETLPAPKEEVDPESELVLSRLNETVALDEGASQNNTTSWLSTQLQSAYQSLRETVVGDLMESDDAVDWDFWGKLVNDYENTIRKHPRYFTQQLHKGIPDTLRGLMWQLMCQGKSERYSIMYKSFMNRSSKDDKLIIRDLARTFPTHPHFRDVGGPGQTSLFNVLKAFCIHDPATGYCQGIAFVVGPLLLNMPEEDAFCCLVQLMRTYGLRDLYSPKLIGLQQRIYQFENLLDEKFSAVSEHLASLDIKATMYASQWFMTMFAYRFPLEMVFRILDIVFAEGYDAVLRLSLALIQRNETAILDAMEFEGCVDFLQNGLFDAYIGNIDSLIYDASQIKIPKSRLDKLAEEHVEMVRKTSQDFVDACNLRNENYRLADRLKILEADYEVLTKEHVAMANAKIEAQLALERSLERNEELEITLSGLKEILSDDRKSAEYQVKVEMDMLAQKNVDLIGKNALLEEEIVGLQEQLVEMRVQVEDAETSRNEIVNKLDALKKAFQ